MLNTLFRMCNIRYSDFYCFILLIYHLYHFGPSTGNHLFLQHQRVVQPLISFHLLHEGTVEVNVFRTLKVQNSVPADSFRPGRMTSDQNLLPLISHH